MQYSIKGFGPNYTVSVDNCSIQESNENAAKRYDGYINGSLDYCCEQIKAIEKRERERKDKK